MIKTGQILSITGIVGYLALMTLVLPGLRDSVNASQGALLAVNLLAALGAIGIFGAWGLALYHWGTRFNGSSSSKRRWGFGLTLGAFVGSWIYWFTRKHPANG